MKGRFKLGLEKLVRASKKVSRAIKENAKIAAALLGIGVGSYFIDKHLPDAHADEPSDGIVAVTNYTPDTSVSNSRVIIRDNNTDAVSPGSAPPTLVAYIYDPNSPVGPYLGAKGINSQNTNAVKIWFESMSVPPNIEHFIKLKIYSRYGLPADMNDYTTRNLTLHQEPNNVNADPNLYDIKDLTNWGTEYGRINLPNISSDPNLNNSQWIFRSDNYADLNFSGKVNLEDCAIWASNWLRNDCNSTNNWCGFSDMDRSGSVDFYDGALLGNEWGYDTNDPNTWQGS